VGVPGLITELVIIFLLSSGLKIELDNPYIKHVFIFTPYQPTFNMGNPDGTDNATCANTGVETIPVFEGVDPKYIQELMRLAKANVDEREKKEKESRDADIAKCEAIIADLDPKIAELDVKIDETVGQIKTATRERDEAERLIDLSDIEFAEVSRVYEKVIPLKTRYEPIGKEVEKLNRRISALIEFDKIVKECAVDRMKMDSEIHAAGQYNTDTHNKIRKLYDPSKERFYRAASECSKIVRHIQYTTINAGTFEGCHSDLLSWDLDRSTDSRKYYLPEFEKLRPQYQAMCIKFPLTEHEGINNRYISVNSKRENVYEVYKVARAKLVHLERKLERQRDKIDEPKRRRKEAAAELEVLNAAS
jgi:hypothetical protein